MPVSDTETSHVNMGQDSTPTSITKADLVACLGLRLEQVETKLNVADIQAEEINEPPTDLRGLAFSLPQDRSLMLFLDQDDAILAAQNKALKWDISVLGKVSVIGLRYKAGQEVLSVGEIPVTFRLHDSIRADKARSKESRKAAGGRD